MRQLLLQLLVALLALASSLAAQTKLSTDSSIGVWPFLVGDVDRYQDEILAKSKAAGLDRIYMHLWSTRGSKTGILRIQDEAKSWQSSWGSLAPRITLSRFIQKAHAQGIQVVGVVQVFHSPGPLPSDYAHQDFLIQRVLRYLVHSRDASGKPLYALDGIAFDYIRWFGGSHSSKDVHRFLDAARKEMGSMPIHCFVIAGAYAMDGGTYDAKFRTYTQVRSYLSSNYGQDWEGLASRIDCLLPMAYTANGHVYGTRLDRMEAYLAVVARYARQAVSRVQSSCTVVPAIRTWDTTKEKTTKATILACTKGAMSGGADGTMAFRYFTARSHKDWFTALATYVKPGVDLPIARASFQALAGQIRVDPSASTHGKYAASQLRARFDLDGDGRFELGPFGLTARSFPVSWSGTRVLSVEISDPIGQRGIARQALSLAASFTPTLASLSASAGGKQSYTFAAGQANAGKAYLVLGTLSGTSPGIPLPGRKPIPINLDGFTALGLSSLNRVPFVRFLGTLSLGGTAWPEFQVPRGLIPATLVGQRFHFASLILDPTGVAVVSNPVELRIFR